MVCWKRLAILSLGSLVCTGGNASSRDGLYLGAGVGGSYDQYALLTTNLTSGFGIQSPTLHQSSILGDLFLGFGGTANTGFYFAGELGTYFPKRSATLTRPGIFPSNFTFRETLRVQDYATLDLLPGYRFNEGWLLYARGGLTYAQMGLYQFANAMTSSFNTEQNRLGGRIGAGVNYAINNNFGLGLDYFFTQYQDMNAKTFALNTRFNQQLSSNFVGISALYTI